GNEDLPAAARMPCPAPVPRPEHHRPPARRATRPRNLNIPPRHRIRVDRQRARPYDGQRRHRLRSLPATVAKRRRGGITHTTTQTAKSWPPRSSQAPDMKKERGRTPRPDTQIIRSSTTGHNIKVHRCREYQRGLVRSVAARRDGERTGSVVTGRVN